MLGIRIKPKQSVQEERDTAGFHRGDGAVTTLEKERTKQRRKVKMRISRPRRC